MVDSTRRQLATKSGAIGRNGVDRLNPFSTWSLPLLELQTHVLPQGHAIVTRTWHVHQVTACALYSSQECKRFACRVANIRNPFIIFKMRFKCSKRVLNISNMLLKFQKRLLIAEE